MIAPVPVVDPFEIKSAATNLIAFVPRIADLGQLDAALSHKLGGRRDFFGDDAAVIDLSEWPETASGQVAELIQLLRSYGLQAVAARHGGKQVREAARAAGLVGLPEARERAESKPPEPVPEPPSGALIIDRPVRGGQQVYARGNDLVVLAMVSAGAEVIADGHIHVYAPLRGRALAGARGNASARIFTHYMAAELVSIAGVYRTIDEALPDNIANRPAQVRLDGSKLVIETLG
ncbi:septum site-determining protein MinC [Chitinimonas lacunae]|uniref:Probable septum site-determining protein MinC n=1 Tax=Chitinimonas lacunae TaxID=1963018 RepID=A0ABV8MMH5_9NEIS